MKKRAPILFFVAAVVITFGYSNCGRIAFRDSTGTVDPLRSQETIVGNPMTAAAKTIVEKVCEKLARCHSVAQTECTLGVGAVAGIDYQLGLPKGAYAVFSQIIEAEYLGSIQASAPAEQSCMTAIENLSCSDSVVRNAYDAQTRSYDGVSKMIPTSPGSCPVVFNQPVNRHEYFVSTAGSDSNDGSAQSPWATINHAAQNLKVSGEGAIVHVAPGTYTVATTPSCSSGGASCGVRTEVSGTPTANVIFISDVQHAAKIVAPSASAAWYNSGSYVQIIGFEIAGSTSSNFGIFNEGAFNKVEGNHIHSIPVTLGCANNQSGGGIFFGYLPGSHDNDAIGNWIHDIGPRLPNGLAQSSYCAGMALGISYNQPRGRVQNNIIHGVDSYAIGTWHLASQLQISNNLLYNNGNVASNNVKVGGAIFVSGENSVGVHDNTTIANNIIRNNSGKGINEWVSVGPNNVYAGNLMYANGIDHDLRSGAVPTGTITSDPLMINFQLNGSGNYQLSAGSPAIGVGSPNCALPPNGACGPSKDYKGVLRAAGMDVGPYAWVP